MEGHIQAASALRTQMNRLMVPWSLGGVLLCLAGLVLWELEAASRWIKDPLCAADGAWPRLEEGKVGKDRQAYKACLHLPPSSPITQMIQLLTQNTQLWDQIRVWREMGELTICSWVTASRSKPEGEAEFSLNGKRAYLVTSTLVFPHVVISASLNPLASFPFVLLTVS